MPTTIRIHELGGPEVLRVEELTLEPLQAGQARVRQTAVGLNMIDTYHRSGVYPLPALPHGIGVEAAGVVEQVGSEVSEVKVGQRVAYAAGPPGAYTAERNMPADKLVPLPDDIDDRQAATIMLKGMTVEYLVRRTFRVDKGMTVLLHAAAGGVGLIACQWLAHLGATVIGTVGSDDKAEIARAHGCHHPIVYTRDSFVDRVREITDGEGVPVVYDSVGKATVPGSFDCLARRGMLVAFGNASGTVAPVDPLTLTAKGSVYLTRPTLFDYVATREDLLASATALFEMVASGVVTADARQCRPLSEAADAHRAIESRKTIGSTVLLP